MYSLDKKLKIFLRIKKNIIENYLVVQWLGLSL